MGMGWGDSYQLSGDGRDSYQEEEEEEEQQQEQEPEQGD